MITLLPIWLKLPCSDIALTFKMINTNSLEFSGYFNSKLHNTYLIINSKFLVLFRHVKRGATWAKATHMCGGKAWGNILPKCYQESSLVTCH